MQNSFGLGTSKWWPPEEAAAEEYFAYTAEIGLTETLAQFDRVVSVSKGHLTGELGAKAIRDQIENKAERGEGGSYIRLGDADGNVLFAALGKYPHLAQYCLAKISRIYFGNDALMGDELEFMRSIVLDAVAKADVVGAPERTTLERSFASPNADLDVRGMCGMRGVYNYLDGEEGTSRVSNAHWASTWYSRALLPHYASLMQGRQFVGFITCYEDLARRMQAHLDIKRVETHLVPMQASISYQTKRTAHMRKDIGHYPSIYHEVIEKVSPPYSGCIYIVAAGILSKSYCTIIKERGGIALDVGSVADVWMNIKSRPGISEELINKWAIKS